MKVFEKFESYPIAGGPPRSLPDRVAAVAAANPLAVALRCGPAEMTYGELDRRADRLAAHLVASGVKAESAVAVCLPRSFDQIVALLAAMKAGGAFLPLDPHWPAERLARLLDESGAAVLIAEPDLAATLSADGRFAICPDRGAAPGALEPSRPPAECPPAALAYIIYTSGSTGEPKGVEITHANLLNLIDWHQQTFMVTAGDRASHLAGLGFDAAVWEVWPYLAAGASVTLAPEAVRTSPELLREWLIAQRITVAFAPTSLAEPLMAAAWPADTALRLLLIGAETVHACPPPGLPFTVINNYGPTECTVVTTSAPLAPGGTGLPPIGWPIAGMAVHLLDPQGRPVADGQVGEIHIGGAGVGRGYRHRPDLTAQCFLPDPFSGDPDARLYRTGDQGCRLPDGQISFRGRRDAQVKIRGHRIEPDEIAGILNQHPQVASCAVVARGGERDQRLVAYVLPAGPQAPTAEDLRALLARQLPDYMIPSGFVRLDVLPLTSSGKLDRAALPEPGPANTLDVIPFRAPATPLEKRLAAIVAEVLGAPRVGCDENFFLIGGHSLLGTQVVLRVREAFGIELTLLDLFEAPTVGRLAPVVERLLVAGLAAMSEDEAERRLAF